MSSEGAPVPLHVSGLRAGYPGRGEVLHGIDLQVAAGRRLVLLGANGCGKTTLLRCLSGAHRPDAGSITVAGTALTHDRAGLRGHRQRVQLVLQDPDDQLFSADVRQDVSFGPANLGLDAAQVGARVAEAVRLLGIEHLVDRPTHHLSYGERKRAATAGAVAMRPSVLLLDEPTAGLDPAGVQEMLGALEGLERAGTTVVLSTHDVDLALAWADDAVVLVDGDATCGTVIDLLADAALLTAARLRRPWPLELAARLHERGVDIGAPRDLDAVLTRLTRQEPA